MAASAPVFSSFGTARERVALPDELFDGTVNVPVMHQAVKAYLANQRQGNAKTKTRGLVAGGNQKPWKQKGTGRARQGSIRAPNWVGGGTVFGPIPRSYAQYVPRQVRALARKSAFNARAAEDGIIVIDTFVYDQPSTKRLVLLLTSLAVDAKKVLILTDGVKQNVFLSGRNLPLVHVMPYADVSTYHLLWSDVVLIEAPAIGFTMEPLKETAPVIEKRQRPVAAETKKAAKAPKAAKPAKAAAKAAAATKPAAAKSAKKKAAPKRGQAQAKGGTRGGSQQAKGTAQSKGQSRTQSKKAPAKPGAAKKGARGGGNKGRGK